MKRLLPVMLLLGALAGVLVGCSQPGSSPSPGISSFTSSSNAVPASGGSLTLSWAATAASDFALSVTPATAVTVDGSSASATTDLNQATSASVALPANGTSSPVAYTFVLTATGASGTTPASSTLTITVATASPAAPSVSSFAASPTSLGASGGSVSLSWSGSNVSDYSLLVSPSSGVLVNGAAYSGAVDLQASTAGKATLPANGTASAQTYTLTLTASGASGTKSASSSLSLVVAAQPTIGSFQASPNPVTVGQSTNFTWVISGGNGTLACTLDPGDGTTPLTINDCGNTTSQAHTYTSAAGSPYSATLAVQGTSVSQTVKVTVNSSATSLTGVTAISGGGDHSLALEQDGTVWAWGLNNGGQLGDGTTTNSSVPVQVSGLTSVTAIAGGYDHSLALKQDGTVWAWGLNDNGQLGDGTTTNSSVPVQVSGLANVTAVAAGADYSLALEQDGTVWAWGLNDNGQLGDGNTNTPRTTPVQVSGLSTATAIAGGSDHSLALKSDGTVWAWGLNNGGQLGDGTDINSSVPVEVSSLTNVAAIAAGYDHSLALKQDGTVWAWGYNTSGELGDGTTTGRIKPVQVLGPGGSGYLSNITAISADASSYSLALRSDGTGWAWGNNIAGQLGDGTTTNSSVPMQVLGPGGTGYLSNVTGVAASVHHSMVLKSDGSVWTWGDNTSGELGDGTSTQRLAPVQVVAP